ncbi:neurogenic locus Notch protein-like [Lytechinus variegatus]|uniref:neurogenic locus Notch protein-like n=1 Tax=Lytechinus variegatus TaxID=7654 RepID=UPI001BB11F4C|nr:neurogenic locus Notch protein-like [Lytechinus variegatus]
MMMHRWYQVMTVAVLGILYPGICIGYSCDRDMTCPSALYKDGSIVRSSRRMWNNSYDTDIANYIMKCHTGNACSNNPCLNGGSCVEDNFGSYYCYCERGFDGKSCDILPQVLTRSNGGKQISLANVSDLSFTTLFTTNDLEIIDFVFDETNSTIYFAHSTLSNYYSAHIRMTTGINTSVLIFENPLGRLYLRGIFG